MRGNTATDLMAMYGMTVHPANTPQEPRPNRHQRRRAKAVNRRFGVKDDE